MNASEATDYYIRQASRIMDLGAHVERLLLSPKAEHNVSIPIELDNGELTVFSGHRIQHNSARGPMTGRPLDLNGSEGREAATGRGVGTKTV